ncbi:MAG: GIY-YIG nuclease family protein [Oscillospiraceae bacterium]|nr:GIY-YIG nuclease family protein [Oscillospiraceae bacterium]
MSAEIMLKAMSVIFKEDRYDRYNGLMEFSFEGWNGKSYRILRNEFEKGKYDRQEWINQPGIYFLFGLNKETNKDIVYVGKSDNTILSRIKNHVMTKDYWREAVTFIKTGEHPFGRDETAWLEKYFYVIAQKAGRYEVYNDKTPDTGIVNHIMEIALKEYVYNMKMILGTLNHIFFESTETVDKPIIERPIIYKNYTTEELETIVNSENLTVTYSNDKGIYRMRLIMALKKADSDGNQND